jgi:hypothetical protein
MEITTAYHDKTDNWFIHLRLHNAAFEDGYATIRTNNGLWKYVLLSEKSTPPEKYPTS